MQIMDITKETLQALLSVLKVDAICREKHEAVKAQDFQSALKLREIEIEERKSLVSYSRLKELSDALNAEPPTTN